MGYQTEYIIDPEIEDDEKIVTTKTMEPVSIPNNKIGREYEVIEEPEGPRKSVLDEIHESAVKEELVDEDEELIGGENATPEEVIDALRNKGRSKGAKKNQQEYEEKKVESFTKVTATRDILTGMSKRLINVNVPVVMDCKHDDGTVSPELVDLEFKVKRLTESQVNHLINRRLASKEESELTDEEYERMMHKGHDLLKAFKGIFAVFEFSAAEDLEGLRHEIREFFGKPVPKVFPLGDSRSSSSSGISSRKRLTGLYWTSPRAILEAALVRVSSSFALVMPT